ncbi:MAG: LPXTG cell wall anchor domain-containing protein [Chloroflexia bacterium]
MSKCRLLAAIVFVGVALLVVSAPASATIYGFTFEPKSGGPGTQIHVWGTVPPGEVTIELGLALEFYQPIGGRVVTKSTPIAVLGKASPDMSKTCCELPLDTTVVVPAYGSDGRPITDRNLSIRILDTNGNPIPDSQTYFFEFTPGPLPSTGTDSYLGLIAVAGAALASILVGWLVRRQRHFIVY